MCSNTVVSNVTNSSGTLQAVVFDRNCGATTTESTQLSILKAGEKLPDAPGNALVAKGSAHVAIEWVDTLRIRVVSPRVEFLRRETGVNGVTIDLIITE